MVEIPRGGIVYALSLDFDECRLEEILKRAPANIVAEIRESLDADPNTPRRIDFEGSVSFGVKAHLGKPQQGAHEEFVPLIVDEIF